MRPTQHPSYFCLIRHKQCHCAHYKILNKPFLLPYISNYCFFNNYGFNITLICLFFQVRLINIPNNTINPCFLISPMQRKISASLNLYQNHLSKAQILSEVLSHTFLWDSLHFLTLHSLSSCVTGWPLLSSDP